MKEHAVNIIILISGIGIGILSSKRYFEKKYFEISENEIESVREAYHRDKKKTDIGKIDENAISDFSEEVLMSEVTKITDQYNYGSAFGKGEDEASDDETLDYDQPSSPYDDVKTPFDIYQIMDQHTSDSEFYPGIPQEILDELSGKYIDELVNSNGHVYVFNKTSNICFDITIIHGSYEEMILGRDHAGEEEE